VTTSSAKARAAKAKAARAKAAKAKAAKAKAAKAKAAKAKAAKAKKPVVLAPVRSTPAHPFTPPVNAPSGGSGLSLSDRGVLLGTFLLALGVGVFVLLARAGWRRYSWRWRYREFDSTPRRRRDAERETTVEELPDAMQWWLGGEAANGSHGTAKDDSEAVTVARRSGADAPTGT
jgi:hypothetical protein